MDKKIDILVKKIRYWIEHEKTMRRIKNIPDNEAYDGEDGEYYSPEDLYDHVKIDNDFYNGHSLPGLPLVPTVLTR